MAEAKTAAGNEDNGRYDMAALLRLMACLRDPEGGCPWDLKQSYRSIVPHTLDEVYEVIDAIEREDYPHLQDELGDLLFQVVFYAQLAAEEERFSFADIIHNLVEKLLRRHPHVFPAGTLASFGQRTELSDAQIKANWERIKQAERDQKQREAQVADTPPSVLDDISASLPALLRAHKLQKRAASVGFDWHSLEPVLDTLASEIEELREAVRLQQPEAVADELGDLFFSCVNLARHLRLDAEQVLRQANRKFEQRFRLVEQLAAEQGLAMEASSEEQLDCLWQEAKRRLHRT